MLIIETLCLYLHITNSQTNFNAMKKQEMIDLIIKQEREMWNDLLECVHKLGTDDPLTDLASARYGTIFKLLQTLKIVKK